MHKPRSHSARDASGWGQHKASGWSKPFASRSQQQQESGSQQQAKSSLASFKELLQSKAARSPVGESVTAMPSAENVPPSLGPDQAGGCAGRSNEPPDEPRPSSEGEATPSHAPEQVSITGPSSRLVGDSFLQQYTDVKIHPQESMYMII